MIDILFAYCYENRIMDNDLSRESGLTINRLSSTLSCHFIDENIHKVILHSFKRILSYPLIRHYNMA